jgi:hypothetical protein
VKQVTLTTAGEPPPPVRGRRPVPDPTLVQSVGEFVGLLRTLKVWAGDPSFKELRRRCGVPASTLADAINPARPRLPRLDTVRALVRACGGEAELARWEQAWRVVQARQQRTETPPPELAPVIRPRQLPPAVRHFVGRREPLDQLDRLHRTHLTDRHWVPLATVVGPPGVGKTALAVRWARHVAEAYPDGQLYLDLRGAAAQPTTAADALPYLLGALGVPPAEIPGWFADRLGLYRSLTQRSRLLVVLDDAHGADQVRGLLPAGPACLTVVTSRDPLAGLVAREDAVPLRLGPLCPAEAERLITLLVGADRTGREPEATRELARLCRFLPLAIRIASAHLIDAADEPLAGYVRRLSAPSSAAIMEFSRDTPGDTPENSMIDGP